LAQLTTLQPAETFSRGGWKDRAPAGAVGEPRWPVAVRGFTAHQEVWSPLPVSERGMGGLAGVSPLQTKKRSSDGQISTGGKHANGEKRRPR